MDRNQLTQSLNLREELIAVGRPNRPGKRLVPSSITLHNPGNTGRTADADRHSKMVRNKGYHEGSNGAKIWVSWHYTVDDQCVIKQLPINEMAYHAKKGNGTSIAIEVCMNAGIDQAAANARAARLVAALLYDFGWDVNALKTHKDWTGKNCPQLLLSDWAAFKKNVEAIRTSITAASLGALSTKSHDVTSSRQKSSAALGEPSEDDLSVEIDHDLMTDQFLDTL
ncbi:N-acetylmuramoyl-L-alanine amidase [Sphingobium sp. D43FB]|uniref:peptidoglycan recognition protein family protein n=1 Tax=Sphingobium sp. D43FB TaxID=2017595 RepID=UPI000BB54BB9|nr:N-acetylmuramoyl-L-alanine amidase [Sphingobium sp. D43FB]PBN42745.1 hypothetical protein SxD43FB_15005 [Sphingobium sp. D43FB]